MPRLRSLCIGVFCCILAHSAFAQQTLELREGHWLPVPGETRHASTTQLVVSDPRLDHIQRMIDTTHYRPASKRLIGWFKNPHNRTSPLRDRALFMMAQALYGYGDRIKAFYYLDELMDEYPESPLMNAALEMQYRIADAYLHGYKRRLLMLPLLDASDEGIEMLYRIQQRSPGSPLAERALKRTADYFYANGDYDFAADVYGFYESHYPRNPLIPEVKLKHAFANYAQFRGVRFDPTPMLDARTQLADYMAQYPQLAQDQNIPALLERIDHTFARKMFVTADYYQRIKQRKAAILTYQKLIATYPNSPDVLAARSRLRQLGEPA